MSSALRTADAEQFETEAVRDCPYCGSAECTPLHLDLEDLTFDAFPGTFDMVTCASCGTGYLRTRPTPRSLPLAYKAYYTHAAGAPASGRAAGGFRKKINGWFVATRFGGERRLKYVLAGSIMELFANKSREIRNANRFLPATQGRVLDYGCGNGDFLARARDLDWDCVGVDFDADALAVCRSRGLTVYSPDELPATEVFDAITLSHVLEHVADPPALLAALHDKLAPGGQLYIELPNIDSLAHRRFGRSWRGIEAPRHFALPPKTALIALLTKTGFAVIRFVSRPSIYPGIVAESEALWDKEGRGPRPTHGLFERLTAKRPGGRSEFLTLTCRKRDDSAGV